MTDLVDRLCPYRPTDEWGPAVHHTICDEAANEIQLLQRDVAIFNGHRHELLEHITATPPPVPHVVASDPVWEELCKLAFAVQHNPNCPSPWLVRLAGKGSIDMKPYGDRLGIVRHQTGDRLGFGKTLDEAARPALATASEGSAHGS
ncbi:hypothetical protein SAMN05216228_100245 [Rhizobium tibeticum]|uniref:Uncharacterized protein n=1 Tax=Rhizobium tibeticum TaxID=501024 RepID=A0A1H8DFZ2_9HYPH|nr:hypothetical protein [Rhizobium tibeticum]SEH51697.1 hypothetical protein RTCCBAU85039_0866 [Rhizobium tibeticum]SEN06241.1 hypothetical protein SAMN05216228_100245 [Rhizobium tibeticum]